MSSRTWSAGLIAALLTTMGSTQAAHAEPLRIGYLIWVGFGPLFVARDQGFFAEEGIEVELIDMAIHEALYAGLHAGQIDVVTATVDDMLPHFDPRDPAVCILATDDSLGGDGIVANNDIRSIADLNVLLKEAGLSEADIETADLSAEDAGSAFLLSEIDAAVTWEPWLTDGKNSEHGHLLADSSEKPGLIVDCLVTTTDLLDERLADFLALGRAWDAAVQYVAAHSDEAYEIMARGVGGWLEDPAAFAAAVDGVRYYDAKRNQVFFGTTDQPGQTHRTSQYAIDIWTSLGMLDVELTPADVTRPLDGVAQRGRI